MALVGTNGAGKATLLAAVAGGLASRSGTVRVAGTDFSNTDPGRVAELGVAVHPGAQACFGDLTVDEHLTLCRHYINGAPALDRTEVYRQPNRVWLAALSLIGPSPQAAMPER